jgi:hypothetical protein
MRASISLAAVGLVALQLCGCNQAAPEPPESGPAQGSNPNTSVPPSAAIIAPPPATKTDPAAGRSNSTMSQAQESTAMPMPGQNNDHSAPLTPDKRASGL